MNDSNKIRKPATVQLGELRSLRTERFNAKTTKYPHIPDPFEGLSDYDSGEEINIDEDEYSEWSEE